MCFVIWLFPTAIFQFFSTDILLGKILFLASGAITGLILALNYRKKIVLNLVVILLPFLLLLLHNAPFNYLGLVILLYSMVICIEWRSLQSFLRGGYIVPGILVLLAIETFLFLFPLANANKFFAPNNSIFSIFIAAQLAFIIPAIHRSVPRNYLRSITFFFNSGLLFPLPF